MDIRLDGKVAVVTGGARNIGRAIARTLAEAGAAVSICDILPPEQVRTADEITSAKGRALYRRTDVSSPGDVAGLAEQTVNAFGRLDIWVNNAKADANKRVTELSLEEWNRVVGVCLTGAFLGAKYAIPAMVANGGGSIINISSVHASVAYPGFPAYDAAKAGLIGLTRQIAAEYGPQGIRANVILPGLIIEPDGNQGAREFGDLMLPLYPVGRVGQPLDIANAVLYLASDGASFVTGASLVVDGGMTARSPEWGRHP
jgi:NAD(P)-dependent dehydrogenase (short-subunit alcohol dehydrogenase family)